MGHPPIASRITFRTACSTSPICFFSADSAVDVAAPFSLLVPKCDLLLLILHCCLLLLPVSPRGLLRLLHRPLRGFTRVLCCLLSGLLCPLCRLLIQIHHNV